MKISEIIDLWKDDVKINQLDLGNESLRIPMLHAKYYEIMVHENTILKNLQRKMRELKKSKWEFYSGKSTAREYADAGFDIRVLKNDIPTYMEADNDLNDLQYKIEMAEQKVQVLKEIISELGKRNWTIRNAIEWRRFTEGG